MPKRRQVNVRYGSLADITGRLNHVGIAPNADIKRL
jgi:hypothetical protein